MEPTKSLFSDFEFRKDLERRIASAVFEALIACQNLRVDEACWICRAHAVNHRLDVTRCGQDISDSRLNLFTDGKGNVVKMHIG